MEGLHELAASQHGVVTRSQLLQNGLRPGTVDEWARRGRLRRLRPGVFAVTGSRTTPIQSLTAAVLAGGNGAMASHRSAAWLWDLSDELTLELTVPRRRRPRLQGVVVHRSADIENRRVSVRQGVPVTTPLRTLVEVGAVVPSNQVSEMLESALARRLVSTRSIEAELGRVAASGKAGCGSIRELLAARALGSRPPDSVLESRMAAVFRRHGIPKAVYQYTVRSEGRFIARVDFAYPDCLLAVEVDGHEKHRTPAQLQADLTRQNRLVAAGWTVLRFTWADVVQRPEMVATTIRRQLARLQLTWRSWDEQPGISS